MLWKTVGIDQNVVDDFCPFWSVLGADGSSHQGGSNRILEINLAGCRYLFTCNNGIQVGHLIDTVDEGVEFYACRRAYAGLERFLKQVRVFNELVQITVGKLPGAW